jgi:hypothetical protein
LRVKKTVNGAGKGERRGCAILACCSPVLLTFTTGRVLNIACTAKEGVKCVTGMFGRETNQVHVEVEYK